LRGLTVLPGWIDSHVHIAWSFGKDGKSGSLGRTPAEIAYSIAANAWVTLMAGFTTVQSVGSPADIPLRNTIAKGEIPGPRILTSAEPLMGQGEKTGTPEQIREFVRKQKANGADLIKIFANYSARKPQLMLSEDQPNAACDKAKKQNLRN
jgi:imidazolonepropionase-like amidohydrolase